MMPRRSFADLVAKAFGMTEDAWRRHANPWSVWTRFAAIPALILAVWSRDWIGWWALIPFAAVVLWLFLNPLVFAPVKEPEGWAAKGIFGEKLWLQKGEALAPIDRLVLRLLVFAGLAGFALIAWGLMQLAVWPVITGTIVLVMAQLWRIDRFGLLYDRFAAR